MEGMVGKNSKLAKSLRYRRHHWYKVYRLDRMASRKTRQYSQRLPNPLIPTLLRIIPHVLSYFIPHGERDLQPSSIPISTDRLDYSNGRASMTPLNRKMEERTIAEFEIVIFRSVA